MEGKFYGAEKFKPRLIITQMMVMQTSFGFCFASFAAVFDMVVSQPVSISQLFSGQSYTWDTTAGLALAFSLWVTALVMAVLLPHVVERAKKCLDFVATYHFFHFVATCFFAGFPGSLQWWVIHGVALAVAVLLGEYICMQSETQSITLGSKHNKAKQKPKVSKPNFEEI
mmetsp:Transcript_168650/g.536261  ORF Transcript_168650/g.536261 Transcript_168650/m.536261 type:complete len:170 (+) Transcript_168650:162-671(+)